MGIFSGLPLGAHPAKEVHPHAHTHHRVHPVCAAERRAGAKAHPPAGAGAGRPLRQRQDHPCQRAGGAAAGCTLLRTDDFYLPPAQRIPDWAHTPCANMDLTRLRDEALRLAYAGQTVAYRAYSCREGAYLPPVQLPAQPLVILEGSYSHHPLLRPYETLRVFVTCAKPEQTRRLQAREGARYADFSARWVPLEEGYFAQYGIETSAEFVVDTTAGGTI